MIIGRLEEGVFKDPAKILNTSSTLGLILDPPSLSPPLGGGRV
jgi:hypothetical protein